MMYFMDGKTLIKKYLVDRTPEEILQTQFVIVSGEIIKGSFTEAEKDVLGSKVTNASILMPDMVYIIDSDEFEHSEYAKSYIEKLDRNKPFIATLIKGYYELNCDVVFVCAHNERKYRYLDLLAKYVRSEFMGFNIYDYKKSGPLQRSSDDLSEHELDILMMCDDIVDSMKKQAHRKLMATKAGRRRWVQDLSDKKVKKELKKRDEYESGMTDVDMRRRLLDLLNSEYES